MVVELEQEPAEVVAYRRRIAWEMVQLALTGAVGRPGVLDAPSEDDLRQLLDLYRRADERLKGIHGRSPGMTGSKSLLP